MALSDKTKTALQREKRELVEQEVGLNAEISGLKDKRDVLVAKRTAIDARINEINGDLQL